MHRFHLVGFLGCLHFLLSCGLASAQEDPLVPILTFEVETEDEAPDLQTLSGWGGGPPGTLFLDRAVVHGGHGAARLERDAESPGKFSTITRWLEIDFGGGQIELRGYLRTEGVTDYASLWIRLDGSGGEKLSFANQGDSTLHGTNEWAEYSIRLPLHPKANALFFGALVAGEGKLWVDDLELTVDGKPLSEAPERVVEKTILDTDREYYGDSKVALGSLAEHQVDSLALLARVWGFLKYHHPRIAAGELHWDFELFRILPRVLATEDLGAARQVMGAWVDELGLPDACDPCAEPPRDAHLLPPIDWLDDETMLGHALSNQLKTIHERRLAGSKSFYMAQVPWVGNPIFKHELSYVAQQAPDAGYRLLALFRLWNIVEYWFPYRDLIDDPWPTVLRESLPRMVEATDWDTYRLELLALITHIGDTHAGLWGALDVRPPRGECRWPVAVRFVEERATVVAYVDDVAGEPSAFEIGDVIRTIDGQTVESLVAAWSPFYAASNEPTRRRDIARFLPKGPCGPAEVTVERGGEPRALEVERQAIEWRPRPHDRPGETFQLLSPEVAYLKLSNIRADDVLSYLERAADTRGMVVDLRNYPSESVVFALGTHLIETITPFVRFTVGGLANPGAFSWGPPMKLGPQKPIYGGKVAILVDEVTVSQAEYTAMALRAGPRAVVVGSTTAGADGNVSPIPLPGGLRTMISGIGVFYPDKTPTQRVGIVPDIVAEPTLEGIRQGRDEVLEAALRHLLGPEADEAEIRRLARRPLSSQEPSVDQETADFR